MITTFYVYEACVLTAASTMFTGYLLSFSTVMFIKRKVNFARDPVEWHKYIANTESLFASRDLSPRVTLEREFRPRASLQCRPVLAEVQNGLYALTLNADAAAFSHLQIEEFTERQTHFWHHLHTADGTGPSHPASMPVVRLKPRTYSSI